MIRIRRVFSALFPADRDRVAQVQEIFRAHFGEVATYADKIPQLLDQPIQQGYTAFLIVAESGMNKVLGFALILHFPEINSAFLDYVAVRPGIRGGGIGSALYEATRELLGVVRIHSDSIYETGEYAILLRSDLKGRGLGWALMQMIIEYSKAEGLKTIAGDVLAENTTMLTMCRQLGFSVTTDAEDPALCNVALKLS